MSCINEPEISGDCMRMSLVDTLRHVDGRIILDCDGVLLRWEDGFRRFIEQAHGVSLDPAGPAHYDLRGWLPDSLFERSSELIEAFCTDPTLGFGDLGPLRGAVELISSLNTIGIRPSIATACSTSPAIQTARIDNLDRVFGADAFSEVRFAELHGSKVSILKSMPCSFYLDDHPGHVVDAQNLGHDSYAMASSHTPVLMQNPEFSGIRWIAELEMISSAIGDAYREARSPVWH